MLVFGDLVSIDSKRPLPLPWHCRAPLGLASRTTVWASLVTPASIGDDAYTRHPNLILSLIEPSAWKTTRTITAHSVDEPGQITNALGRLHAAVTRLGFPTNIVVGETSITSAPVRSSKEHWQTSNRPYHVIKLICSIDCDGQDAGGAWSQIYQALEDDSRDSQSPFTWLLDPTEAGQVHTAGTVVKSFGIVNVTRGMINNFPLRNALWAESTSWFAGNPPTSGVYSADLDGRFIRVVFPQKFAFRCYIDHKDEPGALLEISSSLRGCGLNVLSSYLRRGSSGVTARYTCVLEADSLLPEADIDEIVRGARDPITKSIDYDVISRFVEYSICSRASGSGGLGSLEIYDVKAAPAQLGADVVYPRPGLQSALSVVGASMRRGDADDATHVASSVLDGLASSLPSICESSTDSLKLIEKAISVVRCVLPWAVAPWYSPGIAGKLGQLRCRKFVITTGSAEVVGPDYFGNSVREFLQMLGIEYVDLDTLPRAPVTTGYAPLTDEYLAALRGADYGIFVLRDDTWRDGGQLCVQALRDEPVFQVVTKGNPAILCIPRRIHSQGVSGLGSGKHTTIKVYEESSQLGLERIQEPLAAWSMDGCIYRHIYEWLALHDQVSVS